MPRVFSKTQLINDAVTEHDKLQTLLDGLSPEEICRTNAVGEWAIKDVLVHLTAWEQMALGWLENSQKGITPAVPAADYKWNQLPALNRFIYESHVSDPLPDVLEKFAASYQQIMQVIEKLPEETLFTPALYPWMNQNTLAAYFISATASHYRWANKEIRSGLKKRV
ncbi:MAG: ClbS/DfsB family four-helix bundle protein [Anaerolineae bacterium]|nr:ClbS/DfsB family four-helix bundle protein [Anaerolineae bacterium]